VVVKSKIKYGKLSRIITSTRNYLNKVMPGVLARVEWHFYRVYKKNFVEYFIKDPIRAYHALLDLYGGAIEGEGSARHVIYYLLKGLFMGNNAFVEHAYRAILEEDEKTFDEVLREYISLIK